MKLFKKFKNKNILYNFLLGKEKNYDDKYIHEIWKYDDLELEYNHNYIQWLFPLKEKSKHNIFAPIIEDKERYQNRSIQLNVLMSFNVMLNFYGFKYQDNKVIKNDNFLEKIDNWLRPNNHNFLRITRILKSLVLFDLKNEAIAFLNILLDLKEEYSEKISDKTVKYWIEATEIIEV